MPVVGHHTAKDTARLIEEVARGDRLLADIKDPELRETVRLALRLHKDPFSAPDARTRSRIRSRVLFGLHPRDATVIDRLAVVFELLGRPTPYAMRVLAVGLIVVAIAASTALVSAGTVADDALYSVKVTSEQVRLALATSPEDRAVVELSIAEHRLAEATTLASLGNEDDAIVATSEYGEHMANAAAELAQVDPALAADRCASRDRRGCRGASHRRSDHGIRRRRACAARRAGKPRRRSQPGRSHRTGCGRHRG